MKTKKVRGAPESWPVGPAERTRAAALKAARWATSVALAAIDEAARKSAPDQQLAVAVRALRAIANCSATDNRSRGVAAGALERIGLEP